jgi:putative transposase
MKKSKYSETQIVGFLKEAEAGVKIPDLCRKHGFSSHTFYTWRRKFQGIEAQDVKKMRELEQENAKMKKIIANLTLENYALRDVNSKKW